MNFYTLDTSPNYFLRVVLTRKRLDPIEFLAKALIAATPNGRPQMTPEEATAAAKQKLDHPIDLTLREIAFIAKMTGRSLSRMITGMSEGLAPEKADNWKERYLMEQNRKKNALEVIGQRNDEIETLKAKIAKLRNELHRNGIQDPTL
jgi:HAMP domain-containing protein